jgi:Ala-tRNA(Pro) deacylase
MAIASRLKWYLGARDVEYEVIEHPHTYSSLDSARSAHIPSGRLAKCVLLEDERGYVLAIIPASCRVSFDAIEKQLHRKLELASESELGELFPDCEVGALPPVGAAYNIPTLLDESLLRMPDVYLEAGDHEDLIHLSGDSFKSLLRESARGSIALRH